MNQDEVDLSIKVKQLQGRAFLEAFESLKGGGQITEKEGQAAQNAIARLQRVQGTREYRKALSELREIAENGRRRAMGETVGGADAAGTFGRYSSSRARLLKNDRRRTRRLHTRTGGFPMSDPLQQALIERARREKDRRVSQAPAVDLSGVEESGQRKAEFLQRMLESATLGLFGDEARAALRSIGPAETYDQALAAERSEENQFRNDTPGGALLADIGGAGVGALSGLGAIGTLGKGAGIVPRVAASAATGAGMGGVYGYAEGEGDERSDSALSGMGIGALAGGAAPVLGAGVQRIADRAVGGRAARELVKNAPTTDQLRAQGQALYKQIDDAGVRIKPTATDQLMSDIRNYLRSEGASFKGAERVLPASRSVMDATEDFATGANSVPFEELDMFRRFTGSAAGSNLANKADTRVATEALAQLDDFVSNLKPDDIDAGDIKALQTALPKARETWQRMSKSQMVDNAIENAADYRSGAASGLRAQFQRIVRSPKLSRGFSKAELGAMRRVVNGTLPEQIVGYLGSGLGMVAQMGAGIGVGGLPGAIVGAGTASAARKGAEAIVARNAEAARALIASGGARNLPVANQNARQMVEGWIRQGSAVQ